MAFKATMKPLLYFVDSEGQIYGLRALTERFPKLWVTVQLLLLAFPTTYFAEQGFCPVLHTRDNCCDRKARAACAQNVALWQQAPINFTRRDHSIIACSRHIYMVLFLARIPFVVNRTFNATTTERLQHN